MQFLTGYYWALFDGHGGPSAAVIASNYLHYCIKQKLEEVAGAITEARPPMHVSGRCVCDSDPQFVEEKHIRVEDMVVGALENAFQECVSSPVLLTKVDKSVPPPCGSLLLSSLLRKCPGTGHPGALAFHMDKAWLRVPKSVLQPVLSI